MQEKVNQKQKDCDKADGNCCVVDSRDQVKHIRYLITFCIRHSQAKCIVAKAILSVAVSGTAFPHYCMHPDVTLKNGRECPVVVYC